MTIDYDSLTKKQQTIVDMWALTGKSQDDPELEKLLEQVAVPAKRNRKVAAEQHEVIVREAEGTLLHLRNCNAFVEHECMNCGRRFGTTYEYNRHCSDECLRETLLSKGMQWNPEKTAEERWGDMEPPLIISPVVWEKMKQFARKILNVDEDTLVFTNDTGNLGTPRVNGHLGAMKSAPAPIDYTTQREKIAAVHSDREAKIAEARKRIQERMRKTS